MQEELWKSIKLLKTKISWTILAQSKRNLRKKSPEKSNSLRLGRNFLLLKRYIVRYTDSLQKNSKIILNASVWVANKASSNDRGFAL